MRGARFEKVAVGLSAVVCYFPIRITTVLVTSSILFYLRNLLCFLICCVTYDTT